MRLLVHRSTNDLSLELSLNDSPIKDALRDIIPFESRISTWGDEIYFPAPISPKPRELTRDVSVGDVAFWHEGQSVAVFFGPTPMSKGDEKPVPADDVEIIGEVSGGFDQLTRFEAGQDVTVDLID